MRAAAVALLGLASAQAATPPAIWSASCGYCHGANVAPELRGRHIPAAVTESVMRNGAAGMPPFHPSEIDASSLAAFAAWLAAAPPPPPRPASPP